MITNIQKNDNIATINNVAIPKKSNAKINYKPITEEEKVYIKENLGKWPFRGCISQIAKERGVTRAAIYKSVVNHNNMHYIAQIKKLAEDKFTKVS